MVLFSFTATNIVEVYINSHGHASSRCPSMYQGSNTNVGNTAITGSGNGTGNGGDSSRTTGSEKGSEKGSWHQLRSKTWSQEVTPTTQIKNSSTCSKRRNPTLRR